MKQIFTLLGVILLLNVNAQVSEQWISKIYTDGGYPIDMELGPNGNIFTVSIPPIGFGKDIKKYTPDGDSIWGYHFQVTTSTQVNDMLVDDSGYIYLTGNVAAFGPNKSNLYVVKISQLSSDSVWYKEYDDGIAPPTNYEQGNLLETDNNGNIWVTGKQDSIGYSNIITAQFDINGNMLWLNNYDYQGLNESPADIKVDASGNTYVVGSREHNVGIGGQDIAFIKYDTVGNVIWDKGVYEASSVYSGGAAITFDMSGNPIITGSLSNGSESDIFIAKYDPVLGDTTLFITYTGPQAPSTDAGSDIVIDNNNNIYVVGASYELPSKEADMVILKYNSAGQFQWKDSYGGDLTSMSYDVAFQVELDNDGYIYVAGKTAYSSSKNDLATIKYDSLGVRQWLVEYRENGGASNENYTKMLIDNNDNVYQLCSYDSNAVFSKSLLIKYCQNVPTISGAKDTAICIVDTIQMVLAGGVSYEWSPATGLDNTTIANPLIYPTTTTRYTVKVSEAGGCFDTIGILVTVNTLPTPNFNGAPLNNFAPLTTSFNDLTVGGVQWLWNFGDTLSGILNTSTISSPTHIFKTIDTFDITLNVWDVNACKTTFTKVGYVKTIPANVSGYIFKETSNDTIKSGKVLLLDKNKPLNNLDTADIQTDGSYNFPFTTLGEYYILAKPNASAYPNSIPTYFGNEVEWFNSTFLVLTNNSSNNNIYTDTVSTTAGPGNIVGTVRQGPASNFGKIQGIGDPFNGIDVSLIDKSTGSAIAHDISDSTVTNELDLNNLPAGNYTVYVDVTGVPLDVSMDITLSSSNNSLSLDILVDSNLIYLGTTSVTGLNEALVNYKETLSVFPNPVTDIMYFSFGLQKSSDIQLSIVDNTGRQVATIVDGKYNKGAYNFTKDISTLELANGIYFAKLLIDDRIITSKFIYTINR